MSAIAPIVRGEGEGPRRWFYGGGTHTWKVTAEEAGGAFFLFEDALTQGKMTPLHAHPDTDETIFVVEGEILINIDGTEHKVGPGGLTFVPRGVAHAFTVRSESARLLSLQTPGTAGPFYWNASEPAENDGPGPVDFDRVRQVAQETGATEILGPPPFPTA
ncbi:MAG TPA: cupin domain-containing protein [Acidimicrobiia bacterium]|nr:cupin domain-containing protein [Acidimicrobiia bacterium]